MRSELYYGTHLPLNKNSWSFLPVCTILSAPFLKFIGFGYDHVKNDYKAIWYIIFFYLTYQNEDIPFEDKSYDPLLEIYSLRSNYWRIFDVNMRNIAKYFIYFFIIHRC